MIEVAILFTLLGIASRREVRDWLRWRLERPRPNFDDPNWARDLDNWRLRKPRRSRFDIR